MSGANINRLKVLFITPWYPTEDNPVGGIFVRDHAKAASLYNDVVVIHINGWDRELKGRYTYKETIEEGIRTITLKFRSFSIPKMSSLNRVLSAVFICRRLAREGFKPNVIHANVYSAGELAVILGQLFRIPVVITEHYTGFPMKILPKREIKKARFAMRRAKMILPVSEYMRRSIESYDIKNRFEIISNVVDTGLFHPDEQIKKDPNVKRILLVALFTHKKGVPYLLEALSILKKKRNDFFLDIVGDGSNREEYERLALTLGIDDKVYFHGLKSKQEVAQFMRESCFFVLPSLMETFGVVLVEALASGLPVIATNIGGPNEIITKEVGILVPPKDVLRLAEAIDNMLDHHMDYSPKKISQYAKDKFSYETVGKKLDDIYRSILGEQS
ncbi:MAG: glycosyltransferase [Planctomycetes bacterium]|nr:glycosyltransferase [Planctomycetota bacterium]